MTVIDFHRLARRLRLGMGWARVKELGQLLFSTYGVAGLTGADRRRFWATYRSFWGANRLTAKLVAVAAEVRAGRSLRHNTRLADQS